MEACNYTGEIIAAGGATETPSSVPREKHGLNNSTIVPLQSDPQNLINIEP